MRATLFLGSAGRKTFLITIYPKTSTTGIEELSKRIWVLPDPPFDLGAESKFTSLLPTLCSYFVTENLFS